MSINRRDFVLGACAAGCAACGGAAAFARAVASIESAGGAVDAGDARSFAEGVSAAFAKSDKFLVVRKGDRLFAESAVCTHKNFGLKVVDGEVRCPGHGSRFDADGKPTRGPATKQLPRFAVSLKDGHLIVDTSASIAPDDFGKPNAWVSVG